MNRIIKENGNIWIEEIQTPDGKHRRMTLIGFYDENEEVKKEKPTKKKRQKKTEE